MVWCSYLYVGMSTARVFRVWDIHTLTCLQVGLYRWFDVHIFMWVCLRLECSGSGTYTRSLAFRWGCIDGLKFESLCEHMSHQSVYGFSVQGLGYTHTHLPSGNINTDGPEFKSFCGHVPHQSVYGSRVQGLGHTHTHLPSGNINIDSFEFKSFCGHVPHQSVYGSSVQGLGHTHSHLPSGRVI